MEQIPCLFAINEHAAIFYQVLLFFFPLKAVVSRRCRPCWMHLQAEKLDQISACLIHMAQTNKVIQQLFLINSVFTHF